MATVNEKSRIVKAFAGQLQAVMDVAEAVDRIGDLDKTLEHKTNAVKNLDDQIAKKNAELTKAINAIDTATKDASDIRAAGHKDAAAKTDAANANSAKVLDELKQKSNAINAEIDSRKTELRNIGQEIVAKKNELNTLHKEYDEATAKIATILNR